jgi:large subunit ribosomal protein L19
MDRTKIIEAAVADQLKDPKDVPNLRIGDTIDVHYKIIEGDKERIQVFQGVLLAKTGRGIHTMITVRRSDARRAKLYYLRDRFGKARRLRDQRRGLKHTEGAAAAE